MARYLVVMYYHPKGDGAVEYTADTLAVAVADARRRLRIASEVMSWARVEVEDVERQYSPYADCVI